MVHHVPGMARVTYCFSLHCVEQRAHGATRKRGPPAAGRLEHALHGSVCCSGAVVVVPAVREASDHNGRDMATDSGAGTRPCHGRSVTAAAMIAVRGVATAVVAVLGAATDGRQRVLSRSNSGERPLQEPGRAWAVRARTSATKGHTSVIIRLRRDYCAHAWGLSWHQATHAFVEQAQGVALTEGNAAEAAIISVALLSGLYLKIWWQR